MRKKAVCIISGGLDSAVSAAIAKDMGYELIGVHYNYGQKTQQKELQAYQKLCEFFSITASYEPDLDFFKQIGASSLTDANLDVPVSGIEEGVPNTYVPFRNGIFLSIAAAIAEKEAAQALFIGVVAQDSSGYPDCTESFIQKQEAAINEGTKEDTKLAIKMPLVSMMKEDIVAKGMELGVDFGLTWSCYQNSDRACGVCDSCRLRLKGFEKAGVKDPIAYAKGV
ncbi:MAG: 7-cyano-7-deazaguanine synthase QueC [Campylobacterota bacterium]